MPLLPPTAELSNTRQPQIEDPWLCLGTSVCVVSTATLAVICRSAFTRDLFTTNIETYTIARKRAPTVIKKIKMALWFMFAPK